MDGLMRALGVLIRTPFALVGLVLATLVLPMVGVVMLVVAILWAVLYVPLNFVLTAVSKKPYGSTREEKFQKDCRNNIATWKSWPREWTFHPGIMKWWTNP